MAYVPVPKDLSKIKTKLAFNLTKRQLVCFSSAAAVGLPAYLFSRGSIGNSAAMFLKLLTLWQEQQMGILPLSVGRMEDKRGALACQP